jgi:hypothetical protein
MSIPRYDIFRKLPDDSPLWVEAVEGLDKVEHRLADLMSSVPGDYLVYDTRSQKFIEPFAKSA